jgi:hypothetical protein
LKADVTHLLVIFLHLIVLPDNPDSHIGFAGAIIKEALKAELHLTTGNKSSRRGD